MQLVRTVRFFLNDDGDPPDRHNTFAAWPPARGLARFYQLHVHCTGRPDQTTGYVANTQKVDEAVQQHAIPHMQQVIAAAERTATISMGQLMQQLMRCLEPALEKSLDQLRLQLSPYYSLSIRSHDMEHIFVRQNYEFAAAHRLHTPQLSEQRNREVFGKCNRPSGHGHNYQLEVCIRAPIADNGRILPVEALDQIVDEIVLQHFDHRHLNCDLPEFAELNPTVEHIAKVIYDRLAEPVEALGVQLDAVKVGETSKTFCTYRGAQ